MLRHVRLRVVEHGNDCFDFIARKLKMILFSSASSAVMQFYSNAERIILLTFMNFASDLSLAAHAFILKQMNVGSVDVAAVTDNMSYGRFCC